MARDLTTVALLGSLVLLAGRAWAAEGDAGAEVETPVAVPVAGPAPAPAPASAPSNPPFTPPTPPAFTPPPELRDANADRVIFLSTAYTHPAGTVYVTDYDFALLQAGYAVSDGTQITLTSTIPIEGPVLADASIKSVIARDGPVRVAAMGSVTGIWGLDVGNEVLGRVGVVTEMCFDDRCRSSASAGATVLLGGPETVIGAGLGFIWRAVPWLGLLGELDTLIPTTLQAGQLNGVSGAAGIRIPHRVWSLDLALAHSLGVGGGGPLIPFAAFTLRFLP